MAVSLNTGQCESSKSGPIVDIFKGLLTKDTTQTMLLTNSKLTEILEKEFEMKISALHSLEVDIYLNVLKKYLKIWPGWDDISETFLNLKEANDDAAIAKTLNETHIKLKEYLRGMLEIAQQLASSKVKEMKMKEKNEFIVMEVEATRQQLNSFFYRKPANGCIFNVNKKITLGLHNLKMLSLESIFNWWGVETEIKVKAQNKFIIYRRQNSHELKHTLVNKKLMPVTRRNPELNQHVMVKLSENGTPLSKELVQECFENVLDGNPKWRSVKDILKKILLNDLNGLPKMLNVPCDFKKHISKYRYIRYLYQDVESADGDADKFDLQLEETVSPTCQFHIGFCDSAASEDVSFEDSIKISCTNCQLTFTGENFVWEVLKHFSDDHIEEPDWRCLKCDRLFSMPALTHMGWAHTCDLQNV